MGLPIHELPSEVFDKSGVDPDLRSPDDFFFEPAVSKDQDLAGLKWAIPREITMDNGLTYNIQENGAAVHQSVERTEKSLVGAHSIVEPGVRMVGRVIIGPWNYINVGSVFYDGSSTGEDVVTGPASALHEGAKLGDKSYLGEGSQIRRDGSTKEEVHVGPDTLVERDAVLHTGVVVEGSSTIGYRASVGARSRVLEGAYVHSDKRVKPNSVVVNQRRYKRRIRG